MLVSCPPTSFKPRRRTKYAMLRRQKLDTVLHEEMPDTMHDAVVNDRLSFDNLNFSCTHSTGMVKTLRKW